MDDHNVTPSNSRYIPLTQQKYCCVPTCIQMVMIRQGMPLMAAEEIGYHLGLIMPDEKEDTDLFWLPRTGEKPYAGWGVQIYNPEFSPDQAFRRLGIPLRMEFNLIDEFKTPAQARDYLERAEEADEDILMCYEFEKLFGQHPGGHANVFDRMVDKDRVRMIDPGRFSPKWRVVSLEALFEAMEFHGADKYGGFWRLIRTDA